MKINELLTAENSKLMDDFINMSHNAANRIDYIQGGGGNTSVKLENALMAIKASGFSMGQITIDNAYALMDYVLLRDFYNNTNPTDLDDIEGAGSQKAKETTATVEGLASLRPSVEAGFHSVLDRFVLHTHAVYANLIACCENSDELLSKALGNAPYTFDRVPYVNPGAALTFTINNVLKNREQSDGKAPSIILMENHGIIAHAKTATEAQQLHDDANERIAKLMNVSRSDFPEIRITQTSAGFAGYTPWLTNYLLTGDYSPALFMEKSLYPDQLVFLAGNMAWANDENSAMKSAVKCCIIEETGARVYNCGEAEALVIEQTLCCVVFILETLKKNNLPVRFMDSSGKSFIAGWESESYRKSLLKDK